MSDYQKAFSVNNNVDEAFKKLIMKILVSSDDPRQELIKIRQKLELERYELETKTIPKLKSEIQELIDVTVFITKEYYE
jgi:hypothetical protein